ncbi:MAG TPA: cytochrome c nitrite reductase small subunit [Thermoanaerobaculia bacterium]|nr:cytochrome c nitrite reductase small subunit [Thermoanaerobaculia bacterium]
MKVAGLVTVIVLLGVAAGVGFFTFGYARGASYLTNDPAACANCHVMQSQYDDWRHSSHRSVAVCNDCHTPPGLVPKYIVKAKNGFWHSFYFTMGGFHEPIRITEGNRRVTELACRKCHAAIVEAIDPHPHSDTTDSTSCIRCHSEVGHY